jgi:hypothetical protein
MEIDQYNVTLLSIEQLTESDYRVTVNIANVDTPHVTEDFGLRISVPDYNIMDAGEVSSLIDFIEGDSNDMTCMMSPECAEYVEDVLDRVTGYLDDYLKQKEIDHRIGKDIKDILEL